jgi:hypothetical protein
MPAKAKTTEKLLPELGKFVENVNKKDKVSGLKLRLPATKRKRHGQ